MGFIDAVYILDGTQFPILHHKFRPDVPSFDYIRNQLLITKRELLSKAGYSVSADTGISIDYIFDSIDTLSTGSAKSTAGSNDYVVLDPVQKLDSDWIVSWCKTDGLYFLTLGSASQEFLDVVSDDEEEDDDEESDEKSEQESEEDDDTAALPPSNDHRAEYNSLSDDEEEDEYENSEEEEEPEESTPTDEIPKSPLIEPSTLSTIAISPNPLQYINFLDTFSQAIKMMLQTVNLSTHKIQLNSHRIVMLLQELLDASVPFISDMNQLRELLPNDSVIDKIVSSAKQIQNTAVSSISNIKNGSISNIRNDLHIQLPNSSAAASNFTYSTIFERSGNKTPWRSANIKTAQNEIYVDVFERIDLIVQPRTHKTTNHKKYSNYSAFSNNTATYNKNDVSFLKANIHGYMDLTTSLVGDPTIEIQLSNPLNSFSSRLSLDDCYPSLHRAINRKTWRDSGAKIVQLVPPNEKSKLLKYNIDLLELKEENANGDLDLNKFCGLINVELHSGLGINMNEFEVVVNTGCGLNAGFGATTIASNGRSAESGIEDLVIELFLPTSTCLDINNEEAKETTVKTTNTTSKNSLVDKQAGSSGYGANQSNAATENASYDLKVLRSSTGTITRSASGSYEWKLDSDVVVGGIFTLRGCIDTDDKDTEHNEEIDSKKKKRNQISPRFLRVHYKHHGSVPSGIKVQGIKIVSGGSKVKPFKGVKYTTTSGDFIVR